MRTVVRWTSLAITALVGAAMAWVPFELVLSVRQDVGWTIVSPLVLLGGVLLMGVAAGVGILLTRSAWHGTARPVVALMGTSLALLMSMVGALLVLRSVALFPGPMPVIIP
ncbi:MAG: hypothetical protein R3320_11375 [Nitriliruptorales bacterium]|nr:hypothetical protein [Nitriliruptorales bacterium]